MMKKTITPVISVILLIMLTIAVSGTAWYWVNSLQSSLESNTNEQVDSTSNLGDTKFLFPVSPTCNMSRNTTIIIMNVGGVEISSTEIPVVSLLSSSGETLATTTSARLGSTLGTTGASQIGNITFNTYNIGSINWSALMTSGSRYQIQVNINGVSHSDFCTATN